MYGTIPDFVHAEADAPTELRAAQEYPQSFAPQVDENAHRQHLYHASNEAWIAGAGPPSEGRCRASDLESQQQQQQQQQQQNWQQQWLRAAGGAAG
jgi:hypothetical protein